MHFCDFVEESKGSWFSKDHVATTGTKSTSVTTAAAAADQLLLHLGGSQRRATPVLIMDGALYPNYTEFIHKLALHPLVQI